MLSDFIIVPMKRYLIIVLLLSLFGNLRADFYRTHGNRYIADVAFSGNQVIVLENSSHASTVCLLNLDGNKLSETTFPQLYEELYIDCFGDLLLMNRDSCLQVYFDAKWKALPLTSFSKIEFVEKLSKVVMEYNGAYLLRDMVYDKYDYHVQEFHGQAQTYSYMLKDDPDKKKHPLCRFINTAAIELCQNQLNQIIAMYDHAVPVGANELRMGTWDGDLRRLNKSLNIHIQILRYRQTVAKGYQTAALKYKDILQLIDLQGLKIVEVNKEFKTSDPRPLKILYGAPYFKNQFFTDELTGKTYGLFVRDGMNYLGIYNPTKGTVSMGGKACEKVYPRSFKVHGGYAYSVYFDNDRAQGVLSRVKIKE